MTTIGKAYLKAGLQDAVLTDVVELVLNAQGTNSGHKLPEVNPF